MITNPVNLNKIASAYKSNAQINAIENLPENPDKAKPIKEKSEVPKMDTLELGNKGQESFGTYKIDRQKLNELKLDFNKNVDSFREMVNVMIEKQGFKADKLMKAMENGEKPVIEVDSETRAKAVEAISENGYWGVNKTSERILEFAKTLSGGDPSKIDALQKAFEEGFSKAAADFGGELPDISEQTRLKVLEGFEAWRQEGITNPTDL